MDARSDTGLAIATLSHGGDLLYRDGATASQLLYGDAQGTTRTAVSDRMGFHTPRFSPDGKWVAYSPETSGVREVFVAPFPGPGGRVQVSTGGGLPIWSRDGKTLYYPQASRMMATTLAFAPDPAVTGRRMLFEGDYALDGALHAPYDVGPDGTFLLVRPVREVRTVVIRGFRTEMQNQLAKQGGR